MRQSSPPTDLPSDPGPGPERPVEPEYLPEPPVPPPGPQSEALPEAWESPPDFNPYTQPIPGFEGDLNWLRKTQLGLDGPWADLFRLSREGADRQDPRVVGALALLRWAWDAYGERFEELTANGSYGRTQAAIWRPVLEQLLTL